MRPSLTLLLVLFCLLLIGCKHEPKNPSEAAERYYGYLVEGDVDKYMQSVANFDSLPEDYRSQLRDMLLQHLYNEQRLRGGLVSAKAMRDTMLDANHAVVFMEVAYADSTIEQIMVPVMHTEEGWRMQ